MGQTDMPNTTITSTFVVRFWCEWTGAEARWRGRVEHVESGQRASFLTLAGLLGFFGRFGIDVAVAPADRGESTQKPWRPGANAGRVAHTHSEPDISDHTQGGFS